MSNTNNTNNTNTNSKYWLTLKGTREGNQMTFPRPYTPSAQTSEPDYLRRRFEQIREDIAWAEAMARQLNSKI